MGDDKPSCALEGQVLVTEISGSESVVHFDAAGQTWVSQSAGVHPIKVGGHAKFAADLNRAIYFNEAGQRMM
jgi:glycerol transport system ATP-binding protein